MSRIVPGKHRPLPGMANKAFSEITPAIGPVFTQFDARAALGRDGIGGFQSGRENVVSQMSEIEP